jgi:hypothetical protein
MTMQVHQASQFVLGMIVGGGAIYIGNNILD